jgi:transcriptional regulator with XRE-family HTH domain
MPQVRHLNVIGSQVRKLRYTRQWTQQQLAIRLQCLGWDASRELIAEIERRNHRVGDLQILYLADTFGVSIPELYPSIQFRKRDINEVMGERL